MELYIGDIIEDVNGRRGKVIRVGRLGIPYALTILWLDTNKTEVVFELKKTEQLILVN